MPGHKKGLVTAKDVPEPIKEEAPGPAASQVAEPLAAEKPPLPPPNEEAPPPLSPEEPQSEDSEDSEDSEEDARFKQLKAIAAHWQAAAADRKSVV